MVYLLRERFLGLGDDFDITDGDGNRVLRVDGKALSLRNRMVIEDLAGNELAEVTRKLVSLRTTYSVSVGGEHAASVRKALFTPFRDRFTIDVPGPDDLTVSGDFLDREFVVRRGDRTVATATRKLFRVKDTYAVDIAPGENDLLVLASVLAVDLALQSESSGG